MEFKNPINREGLEMLIEERERALEEHENKRSIWGKDTPSTAVLVTAGSGDDDEKPMLVQYLSVTGAISTYQDQGSNASVNDISHSVIPAVPVIINIGKNPNSKTIIGVSRNALSRRKRKSLSSSNRGRNP